MTDAREQPDRDTKLRTLRGEETGWTYRFHVPPVPHDNWSLDDWLVWIGDRWMRRDNVKEVK